MENVTSFKEVCVLNQAKLLESTEKIAPTGYYVVLIGFLALLFYFFIQPRLKEHVRDQLLHYVGLLGTCLVFLGLWVLALGVFKLEEEQQKSLNTIASYLVVPLLILISIVVYRRVKKWKEEQK